MSIRTTFHTSGPLKPFIQATEWPILRFFLTVPRKKLLTAVTQIGGQFRKLTAAIISLQYRSSQQKKLPSPWKVTFVHSTVTSASLFLPLEANFYTARNTLASPSGRPSGVSVGIKKPPRSEKEASFTVSVRNYYYSPCHSAVIDWRCRIPRIFLSLHRSRQELLLQ